MNHFRKYFQGIISETGVTLLLVIIAIVVVALLGVGLFALFSTSSFNQAEAQKTARAYYLAESGIRIVASEFHSSTNKNATLISLQGKIFNLPDNGGSFTLQIYPYWFYVKTAPTNLTSIPLYIPGKLPPINSDGSNSITIPFPGILKLKDYTRVGVFISAPAVDPNYDVNNGTLVTFPIVSNSPCTTSCSAFPYAISIGSELYIGYVYNSPQAISQGGDLVFNDPSRTAGIYPPTNGSINIAQLDGIYQYTYESRIPQTIDSSAPPASFTLHNIRPAVGVAPVPKFPIVIKYDNANPYDVSKTTQIYLGKTLAIQSKSEYVN